MDAGSIRVELELADGSFTQTLVKHTQGLKDLEAQIGQTIVSVTKLDEAQTSFHGTIRDTIVSLGLATEAFHLLEAASTGWVRHIIDTNAEVERMTVLMQSMSSAPDPMQAWKDAQKDVQWVYDFHKQTPYDINTLQTAFVRLKTVGLDPAGGSLKSLTDAVAAFGGTGQQLDRASLAIQESMGKGVISMKELRRQLGDAVPTAIKAMAQGVTLSIEEMDKAISKGGLQAEEALKRMFDQFNLMYGGAALAQMQTFNGMLSNTEAGWIRLQNAIGGKNESGIGGAFTESGFFGQIKETLSEFNSVLNSPMVSRFGEQIGTELTKILGELEEFVQACFNYREQITGILELSAAMFLGGKVISVVKGLGAAFLELGAPARALGLSLQAQAVQWGLTADKMLATRGALSVATNAMGAAAVGTSMLGRAIGLLAGPVGTAITLIASIAYELGLFESAAAKADKAFDNFKKGLFGQGDLDTAKARIEEMKRELIGLKTDKVQAESDDKVYANDPTEVAQMRHKALVQRIAEDNTRIAELEKGLTDKQKSYDDAYTEHFNTEVDRRTNKELAGTQERIKAKETEYANEMNKVRASNTHTDPKSGTEVMDREKVFEKQKELQAKLANDSIQIWQDEITARKKMLADLGANADATEKAIHQSVIDNATKTINSLAEQRDRMGGQGLFKVTAVDKTANTEAENFKRKIIETEGEVAKLRAQLEGGDKSVAQLNATIEAGKWKEAFAAGKISAEQLNHELELLKEKDQLTDEIKKKNAADTANKSLDTDVSKYTEQLNDYKRALGDTSTTKLGAEYDNLTASVKKNVEAVREGNAALAASAQAKANDILETAKASEVLKDSASWHEKTAKLNASFDDTVQGQRQQRLDNLNEETNRVLALNEMAMASDKLTADEKMKTAENAAEYIQALQQQTARENENAIQKQAREWSDSQKLMEDASAHWLSGFADQLAQFTATGKIKFADFTQSIITDIAKISYEAQLSKLFGSSGILGSLASGLGGLIGYPLAGGGSSGGSRGGSSGGSSGGGSTDVTVAHTGAVFGFEAPSSRQIDPSIFANARRFHDGGVPDLDSDEVPIIAQKGEGIFTAKQMAAMGKPSIPNVNVNVINQSGQQMQAQTGNPRIDPSGMVLDVVLRAASTPGPFRDNLKSAISA